MKAVRCQGLGSKCFQGPSREAESHDWPAGPKGASVGQQSRAPRPWILSGLGERSEQKGVLVTHLGWSQDLGRVHVEHELLATPTAGQWEERAYSDQVSSLLL